MGYIQKVKLLAALRKVIGSDEESDRKHAIELLEEYSETGNIDSGERLNEVVNFYKTNPKAFLDFKVAENKNPLYRVIGLDKKQTANFLASGKLIPKYELESWSTSLSFVKGWMRGELCDIADIRGSFCFIIFKRDIPIKDRIIAFHEEKMGREEDDVLCRSASLTLKNVSSFYVQRFFYADDFFDIDPDRVQEGLKKVSVNELQKWLKEKKTNFEVRDGLNWYRFNDDNSLEKHRANLDNIE